MKTKIKSGPASAVKNGICIAVIAASFLWLLLNWWNIPEQIPGHYNAAGAVDRWGSKAELWFLPVFVALMFGSLIYYIVKLNRAK